jgi:hypothetical protein
VATRVAAAAADTARSTAMAGPDDLYPFAKRRSNSTSKPHWPDADEVSFSRASRTAAPGSPVHPCSIISAVTSVIL